MRYIFLLLIVSLALGPACAGKPESHAVKRSAGPDCLTDSLKTLGLQTSDASEPCTAAYAFGRPCHQDMLLTKELMRVQVRKFWIDKKSVDSMGINPVISIDNCPRLGPQDQWVVEFQYKLPAHFAVSIDTFWIRDRLYSCRLQAPKKEMEAAHKLENRIRRILTDCNW